MFSLEESSVSGGRGVLTYSSTVNISGTRQKRGIGYWLHRVVCILVYSIEPYVRLLPVRCAVYSFPSMWAKSRSKGDATRMNTERRFTLPSCMILQSNAIDKCLQLNLVQYTVRNIIFPAARVRFMACGRRENLAHSGNYSIWF